MSRIGNEEAGRAGRGQFGLLVDHRTGRYLSAIVVRRGDEVLEFNSTDPEAVFQVGDLPLGVGGNLEEARRNAEETLNREHESQHPDGGGAVC